VHPRKLSTRRRRRAATPSQRRIASLRKRNIAKLCSALKKALTFAAKIARPDNPA
jgi:hypothetical protein